MTNGLRHQRRVKRRAPLEGGRDETGRKAIASGFIRGARVSSEGSSEEHEAHLRRLDSGTPPIIHVVLQVTIANAKLEFLEDGFVVKDIERVKNIKI
mmetsp:Transcript_52537/g.87153  ORF Transcript_52537/g.87153 Transcript_52537/m.87153 type:complete len:97 (+) Transcript_52537:610-900(+)